MVGWWWGRGMVGWCGEVVMVRCGGVVMVRCGGVYCGVCAVVRTRAATLALHEDTKFGQ